MKVTLKENSVELIAETSFEKLTCARLLQARSVTVQSIDPWSEQESEQIMLVLPEHSWGT